MHEPNIDFVRVIEVYEANRNQSIEMKFSQEAEEEFKEYEEKIKNEELNVHLIIFQ